MYFQCLGPDLDKVTTYIDNIKKNIFKMFEVNLKLYLFFTHRAKLLRGHSGHTGRPRGED